LLTFALIIAAAWLLLTLLALLQARSAARRADRLSESYWELRYEIGQLRVRVNRLEESTGVTATAADALSVAPAPASTTAFIPLASLKK
jgi:hypothetical protein